MDGRKNLLFGWEEKIDNRKYSLYKLLSPVTYKKNCFIRKIIYFWGENKNHTFGLKERQRKRKERKKCTHNGGEEGIDV